MGKLAIYNGIIYGPRNFCRAGRVFFSGHWYMPTPALYLTQTDVLHIAKAKTTEEQLRKGAVEY